QALKLADGLAVAEFADAAQSEAYRRSLGKSEAEPAAANGLEEAAPARGKGAKKAAKIHDRSGPERLVFSEKFACPVSGFSIPEIEPRLFSFNNPFGACPACGGLGVE